MARFRSCAITGGLDDSVVDINEDAEHANGIKFEEYSVRALAKASAKRWCSMKRRIADSLPGERDAGRFLMGPDSL